MTDNRTDSQNTKTQNIQAQAADQKTAADTDNTKRTLTQTVSPNTLNVERTGADSNVKPAKTADAQMKKVDIVIAGVTYQIYCPIHEEEELRSAVYYINNFALDIKQDSPNLNQENLLLLCCLNLYETISSHKKTEDSRHHETKKSEALLSKIMRDTHSIL